MKSTVLTKVNTVTPRNFAQQIDWMQGNGENNSEFLYKFIDLIHGRQRETRIERHLNVATAFTTKGQYKYTIYAKHIVRTDLNTSKKKYYQIS